MADSPHLPGPQGPLSPAFDPSAPAEGDGIFGLPCDALHSRVVLLPVPWEATVSYRGGTAQGPDAIVRASRQVELYDSELGRPYEAGIALLDLDPEIRASSERAARRVRELRAVEAGASGSPDAGASHRLVDSLSSWLNTQVHARVTEWLVAGKLVGVLGGEHSVAFGAIAAHADRYGPLGILHVDAHADQRVAFEGLRYSHASVMERVLAEIPAVTRLVSVGLRDFCEPEHAAIRADAERIRAFFDVDIARRALDGQPFSALAREIAHELPQNVYVSFDIDGLDPSLCPHTGTPVPGGLSFHQAVALLRALADGGRRIVGFDLCEVAPGSGDDEWDGNVAARLLYKLIGFALRSAGND